MSEEKIRHLEMIQNTIIRMANNSFLIRGWTVTIVSALFALAAKDSNPRYVLISYFAIPLFWILDAFYLHQERCFRALYDSVRAKTETDGDFSMNTKGFNKAQNTWERAGFSKTTLIFYLGMVFLVLIVMFGLSHG